MARKLSQAEVEQDLKTKRGIVDILKRKLWPASDEEIKAARHVQEQLDKAKRGERLDEPKFG